MKIYLVPIDAAARYELYCETPAVAPPDELSKPGWRARISETFRRAVEEGEAARRGATAGAAQTSRIRRAITRKLAEAVAEQRLLWQLRRTESATLVHPDDLSSDQATEIRNRLLKVDKDKHARWGVVDALLGLASAPIALLPGPNVLAYYFVFRAVGHYLSMLGSRHGMSGVVWNFEPSRDVTDLRQSPSLDRDTRRALVDRVEGALGLEHLGAFLESTCDRP